MDFDACMVEAASRSRALLHSRRRGPRGWPMQCSAYEIAVASKRVLGQVLLAALLALAAGGEAARAGTDVSFTWLQIELLPELDRVEPLVLINASLDPGVELPLELTLAIPAAAGTPHAVALRNPEGRLLNAEYTTQRSGEKISVTLNALYPEIWLEYYDPALSISGQARSYDFKWALDYPTLRTTVVTRPPVGARDFSTDPAAQAAAGRTGSYSIDLGARSAGQSIEVSIAYTKDNDTLSAPAAPKAVPPAVPAVASPTAAAATGLSPASIIALVLGSLALVGLAVFYLGRRQESGRFASGHPPSRPYEEGQPAVFCTACGEPAGTQDKFCSKCGTVLQT